jgi:hypothetical protein
MRRLRWLGALVVAAALLALSAAAASAQPDDVPLEHQVKAAYLFNFTKFVEWPPESKAAAPLVICVAQQNPFGTMLSDTVRGEQVNGRPIETRVVRDVTGCHVLFVPRTVAHEAFLRAAHRLPILTVGEHTDFIRGGGIVNFFIENGRVRFEIGAENAAAAKLTISSRLLRLARPPAGSTASRLDGAR